MTKEEWAALESGDIIESVVFDMVLGGRWLIKKTGNYYLVCSAINNIATEAYGATANLSVYRYYKKIDPVIKILAPKNRFTLISED